MTEGPEEAFRRLVRSQRERAIRVACGLVGGDFAEAEDVTQDAFFKAHKGLRCFRGESTLETWFFRILLREASLHRRRRVLRSLLTSEPLDDASSAQEDPPRDPVLHRRIERAMGRLSRRQREAFVLVHVEGFTVIEAASLLGLAEGTVKCHLHRALRQLRRQLGNARGAEAEALGGGRS